MMLKRFSMALIAALSLSAAIASPGAAEGLHRRPHHFPVPVAAPELDPKLLIGGLAITGGCIALMIERRRRMRAEG